MSGFFMENNINERSFKERIADACLTPKDAVLGFPIVSIIGNKEVMIENHRGILEYNDEFIRVLTKLGQIKLTGRSLDILCYSNDEMKIVGHVIDIEFST